jgi:magnesium transporter
MEAAAMIELPFARRRRQRRRPPPGSAPGTLVHDPAAPAPVLRVIAYGPERIEERSLEEPEQAREFLESSGVVWVNVDGLGDVDLLGRVGAVFGLHPLALGDVAHVHQRPKVEPYEDRLFIVTRMPSQLHPGETEQLTLFLGRNYVLTFQERPGDDFDPVRERLRRKRGRLRNSGPDYLAYALLDAAIDAFFPLMQTYGDLLEDIETEVIEHADDRTLSRIFGVRRRLLTVRRALWPQRESVGALVREPLGLIGDETRVYLRDCHDHVVQLIDIVETHRELTSGLMDLYLSSVGQRTNEVMRVLTIIATIFIPLSFVVGLYGMNFDTEASAWNMPELGLRFGYPLLLLVMLLIVVGLLLFFRRRGWILSRAADIEEGVEGTVEEG